jgi:hypothetical protein
MYLLIITFFYGVLIPISLLLCANPSLFKRSGAGGAEEQGRLPVLSVLRTLSWIQRGLRVQPGAEKGGAGREADADCTSTASLWLRPRKTPGTDRHYEEAPSSSLNPNHTLRDSQMSQD